PFDCAFHIEAIMPPSGVIPVIRFGYVSTSLLFKSDLAHSFCAEDFANVESLHGGGAALVFRTHDLLDDRIHLVAQSVERSHVGILDHDEDVKILRAHGVAL